MFAAEHLWFDSSSWRLEKDGPGLRGTYKYSRSGRVGLTKLRELNLKPSLRGKCRTRGARRARAGS